MCTRWEARPEQTDPDRQRRAKEESVRNIIKSWGECGKIVYAEGEPMGFAQYAPAHFFPAVQDFKAGPISEDAVFLSCLYVVPFARGKGLGRVLLQAIEAGLVRRKVRAIETFAARGCAESTEREGCELESKGMPGPLEFYLQNGFYIARDNPKFPLLRLELKALVGWQINIQFALDGLKIPNKVRPRMHAPASSGLWLGRHQE
jgi:GNAT superfamily N-acetyltransferase